MNKKHLNLEQIFEQEVLELEQEIEVLKRYASTAPKGNLEINCRKNRIQYYYRAEKDSPENQSGSGARYIKKQEIDFARKLAQKDYEAKLLKRLESRCHIIRKALGVYLQTNPVQLYEKMHPERKKLISAAYISDAEYAAEWQSVSYQRKVFAEDAPEIYTVKGERVRSKSEKILADTFERAGIPYRYEYPFPISESRIIYPDFLLLNIRTRREYYLEHLGMMDQSEYAVNAIGRIEEMSRHGIVLGKNLLLTAETKSHPLNMKAVMKLIQSNLV